MAGRAAVRMHFWLLVAGRRERAKALEAAAAACAWAC